MVLSLSMPLSVVPEQNTKYVSWILDAKKIITLNTIVCHYLSSPDFPGFTLKGH